MNRFKTVNVLKIKPKQVNIHDFTIGMVKTFISSMNNTDHSLVSREIKTIIVNVDNIGHAGIILLH